MQITIQVTRTRIFFLILLMIGLVFAYRVVVKRAYPYEHLATAVKGVQRYVKILKAGGEEAYIEQQLKAQYAVGSSSRNEVKSIETTLLPLHFRSVWVGESGTFPAAGGALTVAEGKLVVMDRFGGIYLFQNDKLLPLDYGEFPNRMREFIVDSKNTLFNSDAMRAHSIVYDPAGGRLYVGHAKFISSEANRFAISTIPVHKESLKATGPWETIFESQDYPVKYSSHAGGGKIILERGKIYFSIGYADDVLEDGKLNSTSQNLNSQSGKVFELDLQSKAVKMVTFGHRNVQGLTVSQTGDIISAEHGPQGGDELNRLVPGRNFGWPYQTYGTRYGTYDYDWPAGTIPENLQLSEPLYAFVPSVATSAVHAMKAFHPKWDGDLLVGSLKAQSLFRIKYKEERVIFSEPIWIGSRIRDITELPGQIVLLTDSSYLIFLTVDENLLKGNAKNAGYNFEPKINSCLACHHFEQTTPSNMGPTLTNLLNRKIASDNFNYSDALKKTEGVWTRENLIRYVEDPMGFVPGTTMPPVGLTHEEVEEVVDILIR